MFNKNKLEKKLDTQVLNLEAMKQVASVEKKQKKQTNIALLLLFLGLFMIIMGILYPIIMDTITGENSDNSISEESKASMNSQNVTLTCVSNEDGTDYQKKVKEVYDFDSNALTKFTSITSMNAKTELGKQKIQENLTAFNSLYGYIEGTGIEKSVNAMADNSTLTISFSVDYRKFDLIEYNKFHADNPLFLAYDINSTKKEIKTIMISQGYRCDE